MKKLMPFKVDLHPQQSLLKLTPK